jgi:diguanylate cyclase (GGDEF)-like protein
MARGAKILVVLADGAKRLPAAWRPGRRRDRFTVLRVSGLATRPSSPGRFDVILFQVDDAGTPPAPMQKIKRLSRSALLLPFRLAGSGGEARRRQGGGPARDVDPGPLRIGSTMDERLLETLLNRETQLADQRQRVRRAVLETREATSRMRSLTTIVRLTGSELDPHRIIDVAMERVGDCIKLRAWLFLLADPEQGLLTVERTGGEGMSGMRGKRLGIGEGAAGRAAQRRQPVILDDAGPGDASMPDLPKSNPARSVLAVPLLSRGRLIGVLVGLDRQRAGHFTSQDARLLSLLLEPAAVAIDNALLLKRSEELSITDDLTKLFNSRYLNATLRREVERSKRYRTPVSLIFLDLDGFKSVNDQHGHLWGSRTLVEVGRVIGATVREIDVVSRFGGDEFTVILPQTGPEGAAIIAERIRQKIEETTFLASYGLEVRITASLGIASFPDHGRTKDDLLARADQAMYLVKGRGKNGVALAEVESPRPQAVRTVR